MTALLDLEGIRMDVAGRPILTLDRLVLEAGQHGLVLGPSGSGKTTLLNIAAGLQRASAGSVRVDGHDLGAFSPARLDRFRGATIGVVFQQLRLVRALTVTQNLLLALSLAGHRPDRPRIAGLLERLGLSHRADALSWTLSQGEAQRAAVARAVVARPRLLLADEPTSALDDRSAEAVADLLAAEAAAGDAALLVVTHDQRLKDRFATLAELRAPGAPS